MYTYSTWNTLLIYYFVDGYSLGYNDYSLHHIFGSQNFTLPFLYKNQPNLGSEMWKLNFWKS